MSHYQRLLARLKMNPGRPTDKIQKQAELVKALEIRASQERMRLHLMLVGKAA